MKRFTRCFDWFGVVHDLVIVVVFERFTHVFIYK